VHKLNWKFKIFFFLSLFTLYMADCKYSCKTMTPDEPPPTLKRYTYELKYERPLGSIVRLDEIDPRIVTITVDHSGADRKVIDVSIEKQSDYLFTGHVRTQIAEGSKLGIDVVDTKRWRDKIVSDGRTWGNPHSVGDIFTLKCVETGFEKQLLKIVDNQFSALPPGFEAKKAACTTQSDGSIIDE